MRLDQLVAAMAPADAVSNQAFAWQRLLATQGIAGDIYAEHIHDLLRDRVRPLSSFRPVQDTRYVLHYSIWSEAAKLALELPSGSTAIAYHNITPGHLLRTEQPQLADLCDQGRAALRQFADRVRFAITFSEFNAMDLRAVGINPVEVVPLIIELPSETRSPSNSNPAAEVLSVGRIVPSKRLEEGIRALAILRTRRRDATLELIGSWDGFDRYRAELGRFATRLGVADAVSFRGRVTDAERDAAYEAAGVYLCTSAHEGFCAPLVEALGRGLPVVAHDAGAVGETLGGAGLVIPDADPALTAEALQAVLEEPSTRAGLAAHAERRLRELAPSSVAPRILAALAPLWEEPRP